MSLYLIANGPMPTTAALVPVTTGVAIKTMLQAKLAAAFVGVAKLIEWGISFDGAAAAAGIRCELLDTGTVPATVTAHAASGIMRLDDRDTVPTANNPFALSATTTGFTASAEGTITATKLRDVQLVQPTSQYVKQFPLGREPVLVAANYMRIRVHAAAAVNANCYMIFEV